MMDDKFDKVTVTGCRMKPALIGAIQFGEHEFGGENVVLLGFD
jgi:hypothetical protein